MEHPTQQTIHSYDTEHHRILCGIPGHTSASKHPASVTCRDCLRLLQERAASAQEEGVPAGH